MILPCMLSSHAICDVEHSLELGNLSKELLQKVKYMTLGTWIRLAVSRLDKNYSKAENSSRFDL